MKPLYTREREMLRLSIVMGITVAFSVLTLSVYFIAGSYMGFKEFASESFGGLLISIVVVTWSVLLLLTYRHWREVVSRNEELLNIISGISPDTLLVIDIDRKIIVCNDSVKKMFDYEIDEVMGQNTEFLYSDRRSMATTRRPIYEILERDGFHMGWATGKKKDGQEFPLEIITATISGRSGAVLLLRDISERKAAGAAARETESKYETIVENIPQRIFHKDNNDAYVSCNEKFAHDLKIKPDDIAGKTDRDLYPAELVAKFEADDKKVLESRKVEHAQEKRIMDGQEVPVHTVRAPVTDLRGEITGILGIFWKIAE